MVGLFELGTEWNRVEIGDLRRGTSQGASVAVFLALQDDALRRKNGYNMIQLLRWQW